MDLLFLLILILLNGLFAMSEIALISAKESRLQQRSPRPRSGAQIALQLKKHPAIFLSTVQVGITMVGILSGALGESALTKPLVQLLDFLPLSPLHIHTLAMILVVALLTYCTVVLGELVPKRLGLLQPEAIATRVAPLMQGLSLVAKPLVWLLTWSSNLLLRLLGAGPSKQPPVSNDEIRIMMKMGAEAGVFHQREQGLVTNVLRLDERPVASIMTPRQDIVLLDLALPAATILTNLADCPYSRIPVCRGGFTEILGLLRVADILPSTLQGQAPAVEALLRPPLYIPESVSIISVLEKLEKQSLQCALIIDEYGSLLGLVTLADIFAALTRGSASLLHEQSPEHQTEGGESWVIDAAASLDQVRDVLGMKRPLVREKDPGFHTLGGFLLFHLGKIPQVQDCCEVQGFRFEILAMDQLRITTVRIIRLVKSETH